MPALNKGAQILQTSTSHLKILGARKVTCSKLNLENQQIHGWSEKFSASTIGGNTISNVFSPKLVHLSLASM